ncbi:hypothetical protein Asppvi_003787 [Aspergillus pseudoviridinutans]|uniref:Uncharacterized protein n=1 Tax=Aspergillus pseudoviridinutans TaxID=1517512 RepID=A0A9P3B5D6_9EURO|nr:uncharacterized protein Asppvi_003787 [Aspergillus pseudoviridinutans]GIJ84932.1 hypothetical protein Asppvi_003787 [Aspergillus pseudoviridinutans]
MLWWQKLLGRNSTNEDASEDERASLLDKKPTFEEMTITTSAKYVNGENVMAHIVVETKRIDDRGHTGVSKCDSNSTTETRHSGLSSISLSDQSTIVEDAKAPEEPELFAVSSPYVDDSTGGRMVRLYYELSVSLDDLELRCLESRIPETDDDSIEALFRYRGEDFWLHVPYAYAKARMVLMGVYRMV